MRFTNDFNLPPAVEEMLEKAPKTPLIFPTRLPLSLHPCHAPLL